MTIPEDDESLERELFARRERALVSPPVPPLEDVLRAVSVQRRTVSSFRAAPASLFAFAAFAASVAVIAPRMHLFTTVSPEEAIRPDPVMMSVQPVAAMSTAEQDDSLACSLPDRADSLAISSSSEDLVSSSSCSLSCATESP